jgi:hypothetical protein
LIPSSVVLLYLGEKAGGHHQHEPFKELGVLIALLVLAVQLLSLARQPAKQARRSKAGALTE